MEFMPIILVISHQKLQVLASLSEECTDLLRIIQIENDPLGEVKLILSIKILIY